MLVSKDEYSGASVIDQVSENLQYIGYASNGSPKEDEAKWAIKRIEKTGTVTRIMWVNGLQGRDYQWSERDEYTYLYKL